MHNKNLPRYLTISHKMKKAIESGYWQVGDFIPPEVMLAKQYQVSRVTMRSALKILTDEKYIERKAGYGSVVIYRRPDLVNFTLVRSFTSEMEEIGLKPKTLAYEFGAIQADEKLAKIFHITTKDFLFRLKRIRGSDTPFMISDTYLLPVMEMKDDKKVMMSSLYEFLASQNIFFSHFEEVISAINPTEEMVDLLEIEEDTPVLKRIRFAYDENDRLIEYTETFYNARRYEYRANVHFGK